VKDRPRTSSPSAFHEKGYADFIAFLDELDHYYGPRTGQCQRPIVIVLDNNPIHTSKATRAAVAGRAIG
jgi:hypothetical protein